MKKGDIELFFDPALVVPTCAVWTGDSDLPFAISRKLLLIFGFSPIAQLT